MGFNVNSHQLPVFIALFKFSFLYKCLNLVLLASHWFRRLNVTVTVSIFLDFKEGYLKYGTMNQ